MVACHCRDQERLGRVRSEAGLAARLKLEGPGLGLILERLPRNLTASDMYIVIASASTSESAPRHHMTTTVHFSRRLNRSPSLNWVVCVSSYHTADQCPPSRDPLCRSTVEFCSTSMRILLLIDLPHTEASKGNESGPTLNYCGARSGPNCRRRKLERVLPLSGSRSEISVRGQRLILDLADLLSVLLPSSFQCPRFFSSENVLYDEEDHLMPHAQCPQRGSRIPTFLSNRAQMRDDPPSWSNATAIICPVNQTMIYYSPILQLFDRP